MVNVILAWLLVEYPELLDTVQASRKAEIVASLKDQIELLKKFIDDENDESFEQTGGQARFGSDLDAVQRTDVIDGQKSLSPS